MEYSIPGTAMAELYETIICPKIGKNFSLKDPID